MHATSIFLFIFQVVTLQYVRAFHRDYVMAYLPAEEFVYLTSAGFNIIPVPQYTSPVTYGHPRDLQTWLSSYLPPTGYGGNSFGSGSANIGGVGSPGYWTFPFTPQSSLPTLTSLPAVSLPRPPAVPPPMPATFPAISAVTTLSDASAVKEPLSFKGMVKASGGVKIYTHFC